MKWLSTTAAADKSHLSAWFWYATLVLIVVEAILWTSGGSGVARVRFFFQYPEGFNYVIDDAIVGRFTIQREDLRYITQYFSFLGNNAFGISRDWPAQRNLYSLLVSGFWPIGFVLAGAVVNVLFWIGAAFSAWKMTELVEVRSLVGRGAAVLIVIFHQGFLWSVGETNPHAAGYASGFLILGAIAYQRALETESRMRDLIPVAAVVGLLCLLYHTALIYLPIFFFVVLRKAVQDWKSGDDNPRRRRMHLATQLAIIGVLTLGPMLFFRELLMWLGLLTRHSSAGGVLYLEMLPPFLNQRSDALLRAAFSGLLAGFNAFGLLLLVPMVIGSLICVRDKDWRRRMLVVYFIGSMIFLLPNFLLGDPGYASVHMIPLVVLLAVIGLEHVFLFLRQRAVLLAASAATVYVACMAAYVNAPLVGIPFPLNLGWSGYYCFSDCPGEKYRANLYDFREGHF